MCLECLIYGFLISKLWTSSAKLPSDKTEAKNWQELEPPTEMVKTKDFFEEHYFESRIWACHNNTIVQLFFWIFGPKQTNKYPWLQELGKVSYLTVFHFEIFLNVYKWSYKRSSSCVAWKKTASLLVFCPCQCFSWRCAQAMRHARCSPCLVSKWMPEKIHEFWHQFFWTSLNCHSLSSSHYVSKHLKMSRLKMTFI